MQNSHLQSTFSSAPWRSSLSGALHRNRSLVYSRYLQLATVQTSGRPANRTVVFRGFLADTDQLIFITDRRSQKVAQIEAMPWGEVCWYFAKTREQFRIAGQLQVIDQTSSDQSLTAARQDLWQSLSDAARSQFSWPTPKDNRSPDPAFSTPTLDETVPPDNFYLLLLKPDQVDHLELRGNPQNRSIYFKTAASWMIKVVNP